MFGRIEVKKMGRTIGLLGKSIISNDICILFVAIATFVLFMITVVLRKVIINERKNPNRSDNKNLLYHAAVASKTYTVFITFISIFPLLGMLGTVFGLLGLDLASGDMENIKNNFFIALTSTAWGIIFSVIYKIADALFLDDIERQIESVKEL